MCICWLRQYNNLQLRCNIDVKHAEISGSVTTHATSQEVSPPLYNTKPNPDIKWSDQIVKSEYWWIRDKGLVISGLIFCSIFFTKNFIFWLLFFKKFYKVSKKIRPQLAWYEMELKVHEIYIYIWIPAIYN